MGRTAIISVDGHVKASRAGYRDYIAKQYLEVYDEQVKALEETGLPDAGNMNPEVGIEVQWDSDLRMERLESIGVIAEVLFPNGVPFQLNPFDDFARGANRELQTEGRRAYNRWLVDFCAEMPERRRGQMTMDFTDIDEAVRDVHWAKEHGLGGISLPGINPGDRFFFDPELDPIWAAIHDVGLPITQHGGAGLPAYKPPGFAMIMMLMAEQGFFSTRSLWMLIAGGVFDRFPELRVSYIETQVHIMSTVIEALDVYLDPETDWMGFAKMMGREAGFSRKPSDYFGTNVFVGISPFTPLQVPLPDLIGKGADQEPMPGFHIGVDAAMFGVDYPHFETSFGRNMGEVATLVTTPGVTEDDARKIMLTNAAAALDFDLAALQPHVDRVGFEISEVVAHADELTSNLKAWETPFTNDDNVLGRIAKSSSEAL
jgi:predicted TIM-barrel fold metal-dependent hydrolase